ncbi:MAG TPA: hypothetical protein VLB86_10270 [Gaiellaceae bacterium]|nr:hypothetical protein [Gaiellaceae bacterium]
MAGPLAARWTLRDLPPIRAGAPAHVDVEVENAGTATWRPDSIRASSHWLDPRGNPIVWDGIRNELPRGLAPGERAALRLAVRGPLPPGRYRLALDLVDEHRLWFAEAGSEALLLDVEVAPRVARRLAVRGGDPAALEAQVEALVAENEAEAVAHLAPGVAPAPDWSRRVLDAHQEGYALVGGSVEWGGGLLRRRPRELAPYAPGQGRVPAFPHPLVCFSHVRGLAPDTAEPVAGLPAATAPDDEPSLFDGRIVVRLRR